ncbi:hypothetical protein FEZ08_09450 [Culicoidibacter larvae]|uniref:Uncharacterized protein n=2 Tax=Culicoidibacter larvae TaxID=2579976 RepID=A0A5R8Q8L5_9FIRM|nr:hypothetical protein FEZ08_09450 [Culicoidibacter larvae]
MEWYEEITGKSFHALADSMDGNNISNLFVRDMKTIVYCALKSMNEINPTYNIDINELKDLNGWQYTDLVKAVGLAFDTMNIKAAEKQAVKHPANVKKKRR